MKNKTFSDVKKFTVERSSWFRGKGMWASKLLDIGGKKCCLGFYALECGLKEENILNAGIPRDVALEGAKWDTFLLNDIGLTSHACKELMRLNDNEFITDEIREWELTTVFENCGVAVRFVD